MLLLTVFQNNGNAQMNGANNISKDTQAVKPANTVVGVSDTLPVNYHFFYPERTTCKAFSLRRFPHRDIVETVKVEKAGAAIVMLPVKEREPLLKIKGNILYDVYYRSNIDTPYAEKNVYQHTIQTYLDVTWKDNYPFRVYITKRFGNSPFFRNYTDLNAQFNPNEFSQRIKERLLSLALKAIKSDTIEALRKMLEQKADEMNALRGSLKDPGLLQKMVEEREKSMVINKEATPVVQEIKLPAGINWQKYKFNKTSSIDTLENRVQTDSIKNRLESYQTIMEKKKHKLDSLEMIVKKLDSQYQAMKLLVNTKSNLLKKDISEIRTTAALKDKLQELHIADSVLPKGYKTLFALKSLGIGRSIADYSELSAKNISITGIQVEYNPHYYYAVAAGTVDYRFRDYIISTPGQQKQWLGLVRAGKGEKDSNHIIFTYYTGKRQFYNSTTSQQGNSIPNYNLMGFTIESRFNINRTSYITAEIAKSSLPYYSSDSTKGRDLIGNVFKMSDRSNEAWAAKLYTYIPYTKTTINAVYRHTGANFQSFSLFTTGSAQSAWSVKAEQPFFRRRLSIVAAIRENDFVNSFTNTAYQSNTVIKSIQATLRIRKWPVVSVGYFPSSQITKLGDGRFSENLFYTLMGSASHFYKFKRVQFNSTLVYTQFYNKSSDSGFVYFNTKNLLFSQSCFIGKMDMQFNISAASNTSYRLYVLEQHTNYTLNKWLGLGAGVKYNKQTVFNIEQWGWTGNIKLKVPRLGDLQLMFDKGFIPGANRQLVENKMGRLTYFKTF